MIKRLSEQHVDHVLMLWNHMSSTDDWIYEPMTNEEFTSLFLCDTNRYSYGYFVEDDLVGFASGCYYPERKTAYITMVVVRPAVQKQGFGSVLLSTVEEAIQSNHPDVPIELVFWNPTALSWTLPNHPNVHHPGAPGVVKPSDAYTWFCNRGYTEYAVQDVYYQSLDKYHESSSIADKRNALLQDHITITYYDSNLHQGLKEFFDVMKNPAWFYAVQDGRTKGQPVIVVLDNNRVIGFAGPLYVQTTKRGYFAGIGVHPDYRKRGIASVLFAELCSRLKQIGAEYMTLFTGQNNPARHVYLSAGFTVSCSFANLRK